MKEHATTDALTTLARAFHASAEKNPESSCLVVANVTYTYRVILGSVLQLASQLQSKVIRCLGILASRSVDAYVAVLAAQWLGITFVPLNPKLPLDRLQNIIQHAKIDALLFDEERQALSQALLATNLPHVPTISLRSISNHPVTVFAPLIAKPEQLAYLLYTSGSTGEPKGVPVSYANFSAFMQAIQQRYALKEKDRVSQYSQLSFDVSFFDMVLAWSHGATLCVVPEEELIAPKYFIKNQRITCWLSVPTVIHFMQKLAMLHDDVFPDLKYSLFTGETLLKEQAIAWQQAAPHSQIENLYGPTEATVDCMAQVFHTKEASTYFQDQVPMGKPFPHVLAVLLNEDHQFVSAGGQGQLALAGPQVVSSYWQDDALSQQKWIELHHPDHGKQDWFLTGDHCYQDEKGLFYFLGRMDRQVKLLGQRVELEEIEFYIRKLTNSSNAVALLLMAKEYPTLIAATDNAEIDGETLKRQLANHLPPYMIPEKICYVPCFPVNQSGKVDRQTLQVLLKALSTGESS